MRQVRAKGRPDSPVRMDILVRSTLTSRSRSMWLSLNHACRIGDVQFIDKDLEISALQKGICIAAKGSRLLRGRTRIGCRFGELLARLWR